MKPQDARSVEDLIDIVASRARPKYQFFWGHRPRVPGDIDQSCLSNWFPSSFVVDGVSYSTAEHFMMAEKALLFGDDSIRGQILKSGSPGAAKSLGRRVSGFDEAIWEAKRFEIVVRGNLAKFTQNESMMAFLQTTGSKVLVEASPQDRIWGVGIAVNDDRVKSPQLWNGLNLLGFALMEVRQQLTVEK